MVGYKKLYDLASFIKEKYVDNLDSTLLSIEIVPDDFLIEVNLLYKPVVTMKKISCTVNLNRNTDNDKKSSGDDN